MNKTNHNKPWSAEDAWIAYRQGGSYKEAKKLSESLGRTTAAVYNVNLAIRKIANINNIDEARRTLLKHGKWSKETAEALLESWRRINLSPSSSTAVGTSVAKSTSTNSLLQATQHLDVLIEALKTGIEDVVFYAVDEKIKEQLRAKDEEIAALRAVVDAAKQSNLAETIMERLRSS